MINWKKHLSFILFFICTLTGFWFLSGQIDTKKLSSTKKILTPPKSETAPETQIRAPASVPQNVQIPSPHTQIHVPAWKSKLEKVLITQGAGQLKSATIEKVDSFNWKMGKVDVPVDSVIVKLEHVKGHRSSFRAIVDSTNGKLLQTWDHPQFDNFGNKQAAGIAIDPRYHND